MCIAAKVESGFWGLGAPLKKDILSVRFIRDRVLGVGHTKEMRRQSGRCAGSPFWELLVEIEQYL